MREKIHNNNNNNNTNNNSCNNNDDNNKIMSNNNNRKRITRHFLSISELMNRISPKVTCICFVSSVLFVLIPLLQREVKFWFER